jgi:hypothetical protein
VPTRANCAKAGAGSSDTYAQNATTQVSLNARAAIDVTKCGRPSKTRWTDKGK